MTQKLIMPLFVLWILKTWLSELVEKHLKKPNPVILIFQKKEFHLYAWTLHTSIRCWLMDLVGLHYDHVELDTNWLLLLILYVFVFNCFYICFQALILCKRLPWLRKLNIKMLLWKQHGLLAQP